MNRNRFVYFIIGTLVVASGLASRRYAAVLPSFVAEYAGDTLWAVMAFVGIGFLAPRWSSLRVAVVALLVCYAVEVSQFYHATWVDSIRATRPGALVLGYGFLWSDLVCYTVGVGVGAGVEIAIRQKTTLQ